MDPPTEGLLGFRIDVSLPDQAAEGGLNMGAWAAKAIVKVEVAEGRIQVIPPQQAHHAATEPDAFRIAGWAAKDAGGLGNFIDLFLAFLGVFCGRLLRLGWLAIAALRKGRGSNKT